MATLQHYKLSFLITLLKILHIFLCTSSIISTHASHYPSICKTDDVSSNAMSLTRRYASSVANPHADPHREAPNRRCLPHKPYGRQSQTRSTPSLHLLQNVSNMQGSQTTEPGNELNRANTRYAKNRKVSYRKSLNAGKDSSFSTGAEKLLRKRRSLSTRKGGTVYKIDDTHQVCFLNLETPAAPYFGFRSKHTQATSKTRTESDSPTNAEKGHTNHKCEQTHLQTSRWCNRSPVASPREPPKNVQTTKPGRRRDYQHNPSTTGISKPRLPVCHTTQAYKNVKGDVNCRRGGYLAQGYSSNSQSKLLHTAYQHTKQVTTDKTQPNYGREAHPKSGKRQRTMKEPHNPPSSCQAYEVKLRPKKASLLSCIQKTSTCQHTTWKKRLHDKHTDHARYPRPRTTSTISQDMKQSTLKIHGISSRIRTTACGVLEATPQASKATHKDKPQQYKSPNTHEPIISTFAC